MNHFNLHRSDEYLNFIKYLRDLTPDDAIIIEIGSHVGVTANTFLGGNRKVYAIDPWHWDSPTYDERDTLMKHNRELGGGKTIFKIFCENCGKNLFKNIFPIRAYSDEVAAIFPFEADLIYVDGAHDKESVIKDIELWWPKLKTNGIMCGDDYNGYDVKEVVDLYFPNASIFLDSQWLIKKV